MAKKRSGPKKRTRAKASTPRSRAPKTSRDASRLDTGPLQEHIRKRIKEIESGYGREAARQEDGTLERLKEALQTLEDICYPSMTIPI